MWTEFIIDVRGKEHGYVWQFADHKTKADYHAEYQYENFIDTSEYNHLKILSPWRFKTKKSIKWSWASPVWNFKVLDDLTVLPAVTNYRYNYGTDINLIFNIARARQIVIEANTPLVHLIPLSDKKIKIHNHLLTESEYKKIYSTENLEAYLHSRHRKNIKDIEKLNVRCPFGFGK